MSQILFLNVYISKIKAISFLKPDNHSFAFLWKKLLTYNEFIENIIALKNTIRTFIRIVANLSVRIIFLFRSNFNIVKDLQL